ncbi:fungal-specific transcription factor domain-containing protein, partial [Mycena metata]
SFRDPGSSFAQWMLPPPEKDTPEYKFPDHDLILALVNFYFRRINTCWPVLHRPTFDQKIADKLHFRDRRFAATLLLVISLGSRHSDDHRIFLEGGDMRSAGWEWYSQVSVVPKYLIYKPDLYELQLFALSAIYLQPLSLSAVVWSQIGLGLRRAQDVGAHRRRGGPPTIESEQWKRVFWVLLCLEWVFGTHIGRPFTMHTHDFDQDLPIECDDEYWDLPGSQQFQQPKNKPSELSFFILYAKLLEIQAAVATAIYSPRRPKNLSGHGLFPPQTEGQLIVAFDSALNAWLSNIPSHLRWDPARPNKIHLLQSAVLHTAFYNVQILLHRPYIPAPFQVSPPGALPSLALATNAARACVRIFDAYKERTSELELSFTPPVFIAAIVLVLSTWSGRKTGFALNTREQLEQVRFCLRLTTELEKRCSTLLFLNTLFPETTSTQLT